MYHVFATCEDYKAFESKNNKGSYFILEFYKLMIQNFKNNKFDNLDVLFTKVRNNVIKQSEGKQTPQTVSQLRDQVVFKPNSSKS